MLYAKTRTQTWHDILQTGQANKLTILILCFDASNLLGLHQFFSSIYFRAAESLLNDRQVGCFLVRVSENCLGYVLSFKAENRCRHYKIEYLLDEEAFQVGGEITKHMTMTDLINFYKRVSGSERMNYDNFQYLFLLKLIHFDCEWFE